MPGFLRHGVIQEQILEGHLEREYLRPKPDIILQLIFISYILSMARVPEILSCSINKV